MGLAAAATPMVATKDRGCRRCRACDAVCPARRQRARSLARRGGTIYARRQTRGGFRSRRPAARPHARHHPRTTRTTATTTITTTKTTPAPCGELWLDVLINQLLSAVRRCHHFRRLHSNGATCGCVHAHCDGRGRRAAKDHRQRQHERRIGETLSTQRWCRTDSSESKT